MKRKAARDLLVPERGIISINGTVSSSRPIIIVVHDRHSITVKAMIPYYYTLGYFMLVSLTPPNSTTKDPQGVLSLDLDH